MRLPLCIDSILCFDVIFIVTPDGIKLSDSLITSWEGDRNTLVCETTSSSNPPVILSMWKAGKALDQRVGPDVTDGDNGGYSAKVEVLVDTNRSDNGVQYLCIATYMNTLTFLMPARNNVKCKSLLTRSRLICVIRY